jgi:DNA polymerase-3 subunit delta
VASWNVAQLKASIERREIKPFYALYGEETYLLDEYARIVNSLILGDGMPDFNQDIFYAGDLEAGKVVDAYELLPMMASHRLIVIRECHDLKARDSEGLMRILENPVESSTLVFVGHKIDLRTKFFKRLSELGVVVKFDRPFDNQIPSWIEYIAQRHQKKVSSDAIDLLHQMVGGSLMDIDQEIRKIASYVGSRELIELADVKAAGSRVRINSIFALTEAIGQQDRAAALCCLANLLDHGESPVGIVAITTRHIRLLRLTREAQKEGLTPSQVSARIGVPGSFAKDYLAQARDWTEAQLDRAHQLLLDTDRALKSSPLSAHIWLENLVVQTCRG